MPHIGLRVNKKLFTEVSGIARTNGWTKSEVMRRALESFVLDHEIYETDGAWKPKLWKILGLDVAKIDYALRIAKTVEEFFSYMDRWSTKYMLSTYITDERKLIVIIKSSEGFNARIEVTMRMSRERVISEFTQALDKKTFILHNRHRMTNDELYTFLKGEKAMKKMAASFVRYKSLAPFAGKLELTEDEVEDFFIDFPDVEERFNNAVFDQSTRIAYRMIRAGVPEAIAKLNELITDPDEDQGNAFKSSSALLNTWTKIDNIRAGAGAKEEEDDLDLIYKEVMANGK